MKRAALFLLIAVGAAYAQEHGEAGAQGGDPFLTAKWTNFAILAAGLGYLAVKAGGPALRGQQRAILDGLAGAAKKAEETAAKAAEIERLVAGLPETIAALKEKAQLELRHESERIEKETAQMIAKAEHAAEQEISSARKFARQELKAVAASLAIDLARDKVKARMNEQTQSALLARFVAEVGSRRETVG